MLHKLPLKEQVDNTEWVAKMKQHSEEYKYCCSCVQDKKCKIFSIISRNMVTEYLCKSLEVYECRNLFFCKSYLRSESTQAIQESWGHIVQLHREKSSSSTRYKNLYIFRKTIFYPITNLKFVNIGRFLPRLSGNNHSQL